MSGTAVRGLKRTTLTFGATMLLGVSGPETTLVANINVSQFRELLALARLHGWTFTGSGTGAKVELRVRASAPTDEDPAQTFRSAAAALATLTFTKGDTVPSLVLSAPVTGFGTHVDITAQFTQGNANNDTHSASVSMDLSLKS